MTWLTDDFCSNIACNWVIMVIIEYYCIICQIKIFFFCYQIFLFWYHYNGFNQKYRIYGFLWQATQGVIHITMSYSLYIIYAHIIHLKIEWYYIIELNKYKMLLFINSIGTVLFTDVFYTIHILVDYPPKIHDIVWVFQNLNYCYIKAYFIYLNIHLICILFSLYISR